MDQNGHPETAAPVQGQGPPRWGLEAPAGDIATYRAQLSEMAKEHEGQYVLIREGEIIGFFPDSSSAVREGYRRFGIVPFLAKEVTATERVYYIPNVVP
jgi:hypothetical protein